MKCKKCGKDYFYIPHHCKPQYLDQSNPPTSTVDSALIMTIAESASDSSLSDITSASDFNGGGGDFSGGGSSGDF